MEWKKPRLDVIKHGCCRPETWIKEERHTGASKRVLGNLKRFTMCPSVPLLALHPKGIKSACERVICTCVFISARFTIAKTMTG